MPTLRNGRNNTKTACICLYRVRFQTIIGKPDAIFSAIVNMRQTSRAGIPPDCVRWEKLALLALRLFLPYDFMLLSAVEPLGRKAACVASKVCQLGDSVTTLAALINDCGPSLIGIHSEAPFLVSFPAP